METGFVKPLISWYDADHRDFPWRHTKDPYRIWVSEIMLQQTRTEAVKGYYTRFLEALPDIEHLAACPDNDLMKLWEGLGYYSRVRNMKKSAGILVSEYGGRMPRTREELLKLPGIGLYTAGAIASFAFDEPVPAVDGNVLRVYARMNAIAENILETQFRKKAEDDLTGVINSCLKRDRIFRPSSFNQAIMELGATLCGPDREPRCDVCPVKEFCLAAQTGCASDLPIRIKKTARRVEKRTVLLIHDGNETAVQKRPEKGLLAGLYEFPNAEGYLDENEALKLVRDMGLTPLRIRLLRSSKHLFSHVEWDMIGYEIRIADRGSSSSDRLLFVDREGFETGVAIPSAFRAYADEMALAIGSKRFRR